MIQSSSWALALGCFLISRLFNFGGCRYDDLVLEAVLGLKEPYGSSNAAIANFIEVPFFCLEEFVFGLVLVTSVISMEISQHS